MYCRTRLFAVLPSHPTPPERKVTTAIGDPRHLLQVSADPRHPPICGETVTAPITPVRMA